MLRSAFRKRVATLLAIMAMAMILGCNEPANNLAPVAGVVLLDGEPLEMLSVTFYPATGRSANGVTDADGRFTLTTFKPNDGALLGTHAVTITPMLDPPIYMPAKASRARTLRTKLPPVPRKYFARATTDLKETVALDEKNEFKFEIASEQDPPPSKEE